MLDKPSPHVHSPIISDTRLLVSAAVRAFFMTRLYSEKYFGFQGVSTPQFCACLLFLSFNIPLESSSASLLVENALRAVRHPVNLFNDALSPESARQGKGLDDYTLPIEGDAATRDFIICISPPPPNSRKIKAGGMRPAGHVARMGGDEKRVQA